LNWKQLLQFLEEILGQEPGGEDETSAACALCSEPGEDTICWSCYFSGGEDNHERWKRRAQWFRAKLELFLDNLQKPIDPQTGEPVGTVRWEFCCSLCGRSKLEDTVPLELCPVHWLQTACVLQKQGFTLSVEAQGKIADLKREARRTKRTRPSRSKRKSPPKRRPPRKH